ncbi:group III truncated hemoglobin [Fulvivirga ulvae]|uniref:group III truncated hemoglobin n=1 Tax=Fulvivirga ulvae TaxID=2904245 RepID=UPI001F3CEF71|nr:group III truncated hemoglobin [Fulvivirga ulvae]UII30482.1 group III truncated hemoglobin [Fulvivirga ulvae]
MSEQKEIQSREEIKQMVDSFYAKVNEDELLAPVFNDFAGVNWEKHLPVMYDFWSTVLLGEMSYKGNPFLKHIPLPVDRKHFDRWLNLFLETIDEHFTGNIAEEAKHRARSIAGIFQHKLASINRQ